MRLNREKLPHPFDYCTSCGSDYYGVLFYAYPSYKVYTKLCIYFIKKKPVIESVICRDNADTNIR